MKLLTEEEAAKTKKKLEEDMEIGLEVTKEYSSLEINWDEELKDWEFTKNKNLRLIQESDRVFFIGHNKDMVEGKVQLVHQTLQRIPLIKKVEKKVKVNDEPDKDGKLNYHYEIVTKHKFIDDKYDKRYDGNEVDCLAFDFWVYRLVSDGKEYYIFSESELPREYSKFSGMKINLDDVSDMSSTLKIKKITSIFICKDYEASIKVLDKGELPGYAKQVGWDGEGFINYLFSHPTGKIFKYTDDFNLLRAAQLLSGKYEGYPLHLFKMGPVGTGKTTEAEVIDDKFQEDQGILESANSTLKALVPSFKEKPANLGYIAKCNRIAIIDELMKMVEQALSKAHDNVRISNYFGQMNMLLEQKERMVGSGNDNSTKVKSSAKVCVTTNNISNKSTIGRHIGLIDATTLSRFLVWIQDQEEINMIYDKKHVLKYRTNQPNPKNDSDGSRKEKEVRHEKNVLRGSVCVCGNIDNFLTVFDSCQVFLVDYDEEKCEKIYRIITNLLKEPMKKVWRSRGLHHTILLLDGIVKFRCIFQDYDSTYNLQEKDYETTEKLLRHMVATWDTDFEVNAWRDNFE